MYSLEFMAWVDRCLFPGDFQEELMELGVDRIDAMLYASVVKQGKGIVGVYQELIMDEEARNHIEQYLQMMLAKWNTYHKV